ncbi:hypothetical protein NEISICOT_03379 [Neisseria sicca ATCC 29256]|uniref:Uncharacterized protein n=1 Tax=Neisseria sicca ATCC 29256 TaxID=547045 RepID=C6M9Z8_NEISI|nr:hypothetical protein NEISICOT_03379 [Neisseria sicca ATCC 29256]
MKRSSENPKSGFQTTSCHSNRETVCLKPVYVSGCFRRPPLFCSPIKYRATIH